MKRIFVLFAAAFLALVPAMAVNETHPADAQMETKAYSLDDFDGLNVSWIYHVELTKAAGYKVEVEAPDFVMPYLQVKVRGGNLVLSVSGMPGDVRRKMERGNYKVNAYVAMPELNSVEMSGASHLVSNGEFQTASFSLELSGASSLKGLEMKANTADIRCSGASKYQMSGSVKAARISLSGASKGTMESDGDDLTVDLSGSGKLDLTGVYDKADLELSAAAHIHIKGALETVRLSGSGAAKTDLTECPAKEVNLELSGASSARIVALDKLGVRLSGAASCHYKAGDNLKITETDVDRGASLKKL
jgi:hypothetical protein